MTQVNAVNIKKIPQLTEVLELPSNADIPIYDPATGVTGRIKAALLKGGEEIKTNWASTTTYAIDAVVEFQLKLWKSLINNNTGNTPVEGSNWTEVSKSSGNGYGYWSAGVFTQDPSMVIRSGGLFLLDNTKVTFPFNSTDFETEYNAGIWVQPTGHEAGVITTDTTNFNKNLTSAENTVQKALDKIDDLDIGLNIKEYQIETNGETSGLISFSQLEKIVAIPTKYNIDTLTITPVGGGTAIPLVTAGGVVVTLPVNVAIGTYSVSLTYTIGMSTSSTIIQTQLQ